MKLRFGIDAAAHERIRQTLDSLCLDPPTGRRLSYVYLDTPDGALAASGVALRFRRSAAIGSPSLRRPWRRQELWPKDKPARSLKTLKIERLKQRLDATFSVRIDRWTWIIDDGFAAVSLDRGEISTGARCERFDELRFVCKKKRMDAVMNLAVELGATHLSSRRARERGQALLGTSPV